MLQGVKLISMHIIQTSAAAADAYRQQQQHHTARCERAHKKHHERNKCGRGRWPNPKLDADQHTTFMVRRTSPMCYHTQVMQP